MRGRSLHAGEVTTATFRHNPDVATTKTGCRRIAMLRLARCVVLVLCTTALASQVQAQAVRTQIPVVTRLVQILCRL